MTTLFHTTTTVVLRTTCLVVSVLLLGSCGPRPASVPSPLEPASVPSPLVGSFMRLSPSQTQQKYGCVASQGMQFHLEDITIRPDMVQPGEKINHLLFYYLCAPSPQ